MKNIIFKNKSIKSFAKIPDFFEVEDIPERDFNKDIDSIVHEKLLRLNAESAIKSITIPLSITEHFMEFSGLRLGHHIRLTKEFKYKDVPLIFVGVIDEKQVLKLTNLSYILLTSRVYYINITKHNLLDVSQFVEKETSESDIDFNFKDFLNKIRINAPANYQSRHSVANEWALTRYFSILQKDEQSILYKALQEKVSNLDYTKSLYYKYSDNLFSGQKINNKKHPYTFGLNNIRDKAIGIIDDELVKGWKEFYCYLFSKAGANPLFFEGNYKSRSKNNLLDELKKWSEERIGEGCHLFIIDLRLHDDDFTEKDSDNLLGIKISKFIKELNPGIQIVISTASNKIWNFQKCLSIGIDKYSIKESPETNNNREETRMGLIHFEKNIKEATKKSCLAQLYVDIKKLKDNCVSFDNNDSDKEFKKQILDDNGIIDQILKLLLIDPYNNNILNQCLLLCFSALEKYANLSSVGDFAYDKRVKGSHGHVFDKMGNKKDVFTATENDKISTYFDIIYGKFDFQKVEKETPKSVKYYSTKELKSAYKEGLDNSFLVRIISILKYRDNIQDGRIDKILKLRYYRSNVAAHDTGSIDRSKYSITVEDIRFFISLFMDIFN